MNSFLFFGCMRLRSPTPDGGRGVRPSAQLWSRIEPGAVTDAAVCRSLPLLAEQET